MADDFSMFHSLGEGERDENGKPVIVPQAQQFVPPVAQNPYTYSQPVQHPSPYQQQQHPPQQPQQLAPPVAGSPSPYAHSAASPGPYPQEYGAGAASASVVPDPAIQGLSGQMAQMGVADDTAAAAATAPAAGTAYASKQYKKKHRHAYHDIGTAAGTSQAFNGMPQQVTGLAQNPSQFLNAPGGPRAVQSSTSISSAYAGYAPGAQSFQGAASAPSPSSAVQTQQGQVDPEQIPSVPRTRDAAYQYYTTSVYPTMERHLPPPATIPFVAYDQGNSSPKFARLTLNNIPSTSEMLSSTALPLGMILQPLASLDPGEQQIPVLDFGDLGPPRCRRCRAYMNPFMTFKAGGNKFVCNMCNFPNDVPPEYFSPLDQAGVRMDRMQRPELMMGTVEYMVPKEHWTKEPIGLRWLFLIDVTQEAVSRGFLEATCDSILAALYGGNAQEGAEGETTTAGVRSLPQGSKVGIITYDKLVHFYNLSSRLEQAQMIVMPDIEEPFVPLSDGLFVDPYESQDVITSLLTQIPSLFSDIKYPEPALLPAINAALAALQGTGGKIVCSLANLPTWGPGRLFLREDPKAHGTDAEKKYLTTDHPDWKKTAGKLADSGVGIDFFIAAGGGTYMDIATIGYTAAVSGGETFFYPNFNSPRDVLKLSSEMTRTVRRETGYQALLKVRCSNGLQVAAYHGNFLQHTFQPELELGSIDADKALAVMFSYDGKLDINLDAHFQAALLYTTASGQRRVRCINIVAAVNEGSVDIMKAIDQDAVVNFIAKQAASRVPEKLPREIRSGITQKTVDIFAAYRKNFSQNHPPGQLVLPENLKEFSMYMLGLIKSRAFKGGHEPTDRRIHDIRMLRSFGCTELSLYLYPRIIPIHNMTPEDGFADANGQLRLPPSIRASFSRIEEGGAYIVDNGQLVLLWLHAAVSPNLLEDLFGPEITSLRRLNPATSAIPVLETHLNAQVRNILQYLSTVRGSKSVTIQLARQGLDGAEYEFARLLVEDRNNEAQSYVDWLVHLHRNIQLELGGHKVKDDDSGFTGLRPPYW
ncbi:COPII coat Sec23p-Sfb3p heterodimer component [Ascosphaera aggregata]|nr:COPII coat Sec23p-Sfb3p heterodimer component [Ascosphaera aggregata]